MKLHLPTRLRKAVVASLVAVASLATTLSTSTLFAAGSVAWIVAATQSQAGEWIADASSPDKYDCYKFTGSNDATSLDITEGDHVKDSATWIRSDVDNLSASLTSITQVEGSTLNITGTYNNATKSFNQLVVDTLKMGAAGTGAGALKIADSTNAKQYVTIKQIQGTLSSLNVKALGHLTLGDGITETNFAIGSVGTGISVLGLLEVAAKSTISFGINDAIKWGESNHHIKLSGGTWDAKGTRQSLGTNFTLTLANGVIKDSSTGGYGDNQGVIDIAFGDIDIISSGTSSISGAVRMRNSDLTIEVIDNSLSIDTITRANNFTEAADIIKKGAGTLKITTMANSASGEGFFNGDTIIQAGAVEYAMDTNGSYVGTISGTGNVAKSGTGTVTLANINGLDGDISVSGGTLNITSLTATKTLDVSVSGGMLDIQSVKIEADRIALDAKTGAGSNQYYSVDGTTQNNDGNGFLYTSGDFVLFNGYVWEGTLDDNLIVSNDGTNTYVSTAGVAGTTYFVSSGAVDVSASTGAELYSVRGGTMNISGTMNASDIEYTSGAITLADADATLVLDSAANAAQLLSTVTGANGTIKVATNTTMTAAAQAQGKLAVEDATLTVELPRVNTNDGPNKNGNSWLSSFTSIDLNHAIVKYHGSTSTWYNVTVGEDGATIKIKDMDSGGSTPNLNKFLVLDGTTTLDGALTIESTWDGAQTWKYGVNIMDLTGTGDLTIKGTQSTGSPNEYNYVTAKLKDTYTGSITVQHGTGTLTKLTVSADGDINLKGLTLTGGNKAQVDLSGVTGTKNLGAVALGENTVLNLSGSVGDMTTSGAGSLVFNGAATINGEVYVNSKMTGAADLTIANGASLICAVNVADDGSATPYTMNAAVNGPIKLVVSNIGAIGDAGLTVFDGSTLPTNVLVDHALAADATEQYTYANGKITKTALTAATAGDLTWKMDGVSNNWGLTTGANWDKAGTAQRWVNGSNVTFADASGESISVVSPVTAASATVSQGTDWEWVLGADKLTITNGVTIAENAALTITGLTPDENILNPITNYSGVISGDGTLRLQDLGKVNLGQMTQVLSSDTAKSLGTLVVGEGSAVQITASGQNSTLTNIAHIVVENGGRFDDRATNVAIDGSDDKDITIAGNGNAILPGENSTHNAVLPQGALNFGFACANNGTYTMGRKVILADDATIAVKTGNTAALSAGLDVAGHTLTVAGGGVLRMNGNTVTIGSAGVDSGKIVLTNGSTFSYYHNRAIGSNPADRMNIDAVFVAGAEASDTTTLRAEYNGGIIEVNKLQGAGTLVVESKVSHSAQMGAVLINGKAGSGFTGEINVQQTENGSNRRFVLSTNSTDALAAASVNLSRADVSTNTVNTPTAIGFALAGDGSSNIKLQSIASAETLADRASLISSNRPYEAASGNAGIYNSFQEDLTNIADGISRTLEITGSAESSFYGKVSAGVNLLMNGSGTQSFDGNLDAFNGSIAVQKGTLNLAKVANTTGITLAGAGATLGVTDGVSGKNLTATAVGAVLNANLTLNGGSVALGSTATAWKATGGLSLGNHALALDSANKAQLTMLLDAGLEAGSVVELFTNVSALNDAAGNALSLALTAKVSDYFSTDAGSPLENYLLSWSGDKLSLIMKDEIKDLEWNDDATGADANTWQNSAGLTNWTNTRTGTDDFFSISDSVTFAGTGETVTVVGTVKPNNVTVATGSYTWDGDGSVEAAGTLVLGDDDGSRSGNLVISNTGSKSFAGGVKMYNASYLQVTDLTGWSGTVSGVGTFELANGEDVGDLAQYVAADATEQLDKFALSGAGTTMTLADATAAQLLNKVDYLQVADGAELKVTADVSLDTGKQVEAYGGSIDVAADKTATVADLLYTYGSLTKTGAGTLVLAGHADIVGNTTNADTADDNGQTVIAAGTLKIDDNPPADQPSSYPTTYSLGDVSGTGTLLLSDGEVAASNIADTVIVKVATEAAGDIVSLSGIAGSDLASINLAEGTQLAGAMGDITVGGSSDTAEMTLALSDVNVGSSATVETGKQAMIDQTDAAKLIINEGATVKVGIDAVVAALTAASTNEEDVYLHLTTGTLEYVGDVELDYTEANVSKELMETYGVKESGIEGGSIKLTGGADGIYVSSVDGNVVTSDKVLSTKQSTVVSKDDTLTLQLDGSAMTDPARINNLLGGTGSTLAIENSSPDMLARVELRNKLQRIDNPDPAEAVGADTYMAGDIDGTAGAGDVEIIISGPGTLTVGGDLTAAMLTMQEGGLTLEGENNAVNFIGDYVPDPTAAQPELTVDGKLTVTEASALYGTVISGNGTLALENDLLLQDDATLDGVGVELVKTNFGTDGSLSLQEVQDAEVSALSGNGYLQGKDAKLTVIGQGGSFSGTLTAIDSTAPGTNVLAIAQGGSQTLDRVTGSRDWDVENAGELTINITNPAVTTGTGTNKTLTLGSLTAKNGSVTTMVINSDAPGTYLDLQRMVLENGATIALDSTGLNEVDFGGSITLARTVDGVTLGDEVAVSLADCIAFKKVREAWLETDGKVLTLQTQYHDENQYAKMAASENAMAGATMLWSVNTGALPNGSPLKSVDEAVNALSKQGTSAAAAEGDRIMAAVAGSSSAILGSAFASDVERQLRAIRNRTTTMGVSQAAVNEYMPYYNAWINAEGDHHEVDADGMAPGYTRDSWGGTVGFDVDVTPSFTMGLAVTAMYGDVESEGPDRIDGDFDTQYLSMFARYTRNAWTHTFVATVGRADISVERTVNYGTGSYTAEGETEGMALGFMYEVGRVYALTESGDVCLQPVFNVSLRHSTVDGYEETACDAGVAVDDQTATTLTFGLGARMQAVIGTSLYNRATILEARALAKFDAGDREGEADVRLLQGGQGSSVKSAELGAFGAEVGVGVSIPMGSDSGSVFADGSVEIRSGYTNINGTVGYRINF